MPGGGTQLSYAFVTLGAELGNLQRGLQQGQTIVYGAVNNMQQSFGRLQGTLNTLLGFAGFSLTGMGIYSLGKRLLFAGDAAVKLKNNITTMLEGNEAKADQLVQRMREFTALTPFSEQQVSTAITAFLPFEKEIDKLFDMLTSLGDAASVSAQGLQAFPRVTRAITQMMGKNKISAEEMMQLAEAGIPAWKSLAAAMGVSVAEVQQMSVRGKLGADAIHKFVAQLGKDFAGSMEKQSRTIEGLLSTITDNIKVKAVKAFQPLYEAAQSTFGKIAAYVQSSEFAEIMDNVGKVAKAVTSGIVQLGIGFKNLNDMAGGWIGKGALIIAGLGVTSAAFGIFSRILSGLVIPALSGVFGIVGSLLRPFGLLLSPINILASGLKSLSGVIVGTFSAALKSLRERLGNVLEHAHNMGRIFGSMVMRGTVATFNLLGAGAEKFGVGLQKVSVLGVAALNRIDAMARAIPWETLFSGVGVAARVAFGGAVVAMQGMGEAARAVWPVIRGAFQFAVLRSGFAGLATAASETWSRIVTLANNAASGIRAALMPVGGAAWNVWKSVEIGAVTAWKLVRNTMDPAYLRATWDGIKTGASGAWQAVSNRASAAWEFVKTSVSPAYWKATWDSIRGSGESTWTRIKSAAINAWQVIKTTADPAYLKATWESVKVAAGSAWSSIKTRFFALGPQIGSALKTGVNAAWSGIVSAGTSALTTIGNVAARTGQMIGRSLRQFGGGISGVAGSLAGLSMMGGAFAFLAPFSTMLMLIPQVMSLFGSLGMVIGGLASPFGIVAGLLAAGVAAWYLYSDSAKAAVSSLWETISPIFDTFKTAFGGIKDAIGAGDWKLAGEIGMLGLQLAMTQGLAAIMGQWGEFATGLVKTFLNATQEIGRIWINMYSGMAKGILKLASDEGPLGIAMRKFLGVDPRQKTAQEAGLLRQKSALHESIVEIDRMIEEAKAAGDQSRVTELEQRRASQAAKMQEVGYGLTPAQLQYAGEQEALAALEQGRKADQEALQAWSKRANEMAMQFLDPSEIEKRRKELQDQLARSVETAAEQKNADLEAWYEEQLYNAMNEAEAGGAEAAGEEGGTAKEDGGAKFVGIVELARKVQEAFLKDPALEEQEKQTGLLEEIAENTTPKNELPGGDTEGAGWDTGETAEPVLPRRFLFPGEEYGQWMSPTESLDGSGVATAFNADGVIKEQGIGNKWLEKIHEKLARTGSTPPPATVFGT